MWRFGVACVLLILTIGGPLAFQNLSERRQATVDAALQQGFIDHNGQARTFIDFKGHYTLVSFGFTQCPAVCPMTLQRMNRVLSLLEARESATVKVVFVTVDPERDTIEVLNKYIPYYNSDIIGLRGDQSATQLITRRFHAFYRKVPGRHPGQYTVDHAASAYVLDPEGQWVDELAHNLTAEGIVERIEALRSTLL